MKRFLILIGAILLGLSVRAQSVTYSCRYWFDRDMEQAVTTTFTGNTAQMEWNVSMLTDGLHTLHVQMMDTAMVWSAPYNLFFIKTDAHPTEEMSYTYWFDRNIEGRQVGTLGNGSLFIDVETLGDGLHTLHLAMQGNSTNLTHNYLFVKLPVLQPESQLEYHCWFDQDYSTLVTGPVGDGYCMIDVSALPIGSHNMILQLADGTTLNMPMDFDFHRDPMVLVTAEPEAGGTAMAQMVDSICTVSASPNVGYYFVGWTYNGAVISTEPEMSFILESDTTFVATFQLKSYDIVATANIAEGGTVEGSDTYHHFDECTLTATAAEGYRFHFWSENGELASTDPTYTFTVNGARNVEAYFAWQGDTPEGAISGLFSIADGRQVHFSQGNLQYEKSTQTWSFMEHQYDVLGTEGVFVGEDHANVDIVSYFGWATSGCPLREDTTDYYYQPYNTYEGDGSNYGPSVFNADIFGEYINGDWGIYNAISNGGNVPAAWKTMTRPEWTYLFEDRANASSKWGRGNIDGINGVFLLPDEWTQPDGVAQLASGSSSRFNTNNYALIDWLKMQAAGAVFLPAAGWRTGTEISEVNEWVSYWSTYGVDTQHARNLWIKNASIDPNDQSYRHRGYPVRLVNYVTYSIGATPSPAEGGSIEGAGIYEQGTEITLTATPAEGYTFVNWTEDGEVVSTSAEYSFMVTGDRNLVANFQLMDFIINVLADPWDGGVVDGGARYYYGETATLTATPNTGYQFVHWMYFDEVVSYDATYSFVVTAGGLYTAVFELQTYQITATVNLNNGGTVEGTGEYEYGSQCTLTATANPDFSFVNWTENGALVSTEAEYTFVVDSDRALVANFQVVYDHVEELAEGWNWWSTYIEQTGPDGLNMLESSLGESGIRIQSRNDGYSEYIEAQGGNFWYGDLQQIANEQMYMIHTSADCEAVVTGPIAEAINHPVSLSSGWNWVGYPVEQSIDLTNALSDLSPEANDVIKGRYGYSVYVVYGNNGFWYGTLNMLEPGKGYMYRSNSGDVKTFVYNVERGGNLVENITTEGNTFQPADGDYAYNMTVTAVVDINGSELRNAGYELAAFVGDECRGSVRLIYVEPMDRYVAFLTVYGDTEETLDFVLTDGEGLSWSSDHIAYEANAIVGTPAAPAVLHFGTLGVDETLGNVHVYPNPSNGVFNVNGVGVRKVEVVNAYGQIVYSLETKDDALRIDLSDMTAGTYLLRVVADGGVSTRKLVKK